MIMKPDKEQFNKYIIEAINLDGYDVPAETAKEKVQFVLDRFNKECNYYNNKRRYPSLKQRLAGWIETLPSILNISYWCEDIERDLEKFGFIAATSTEEEKSSLVSNWFEIVADTLLELAKELNLNTNYLK